MGEDTKKGSGKSNEVKIAKEAESWLTRALEKLHVENVPQVRKIFVLIVGSIVLLAGVFLLFFPGPAFLVIPAGLAIMATEFEWARRWLAKGKCWLMKGKSMFQNARRKAAK